MSSADAPPAGSALQDEIDALNAKITLQGALVRTLKKESSSNADEIGIAVEELKKLKITAEELRKKQEAADPSKAFNRKSFDELILRKMFIVPSFEIHGGVKGLFDLGPPACALKAAMVDVWRKHFVLAESMLEMECTCLTPEVVLKTSGHVDRFTDLMVKDPVSGECFRADKLLEDVIDELIEANPDMPTEEKEQHLRIQIQADAFSPAELDEQLTKYGCKAPSGEPYGPSFPFNLMFKTSIGPEGTAVGYLRPETAQGLFVNFRRLLDANAQKMPFAAAQIGLGFRNGELLEDVWLSNLVFANAYSFATTLNSILSFSFGSDINTYNKQSKKLLPDLVFFVSVNSAWEKLNTSSTPTTNLTPTSPRLSTRSWFFLDVTISLVPERRRPFVSVTQLLLVL